MLSQLATSYHHMLNNVLIHFFIYSLLFDIATGLVKGVIFQKSGESNKGLKGLIKHMLVATMVLTIYPYFEIIGFLKVGNVFVIYFGIMYLLSITENFGQIGIPVPKFVKERLTKIKDSIDEGDFK